MLRTCLLALLLTQTPQAPAPNAEWVEVRLQGLGGELAQLDERLVLRVSHDGSTSDLLSHAGALSFSAGAKVVALGPGQQTLWYTVWVTRPGPNGAEVVLHSLGQVALTPGEETLVAQASHGDQPTANVWLRVQ